MAVDIIARGLASRADSKAITAYEYAKQAGYTGTEQEFAEDMGNSATNATNARESAEQAQEYAEQAEQTLENKADIDGSYEDLTAGSAEQLLSDKFVEDKVAYNFRKTAGGKAVGDREIDEIIGGTVVINQLVEKTTSSPSVLGITREAINDNKSLRYTGTSESTTSYTCYCGVSGSYTPGHVLFLSLGKVELPSGAKISTSIIDKATTSIVNSLSSGSVLSFGVVIPNGTTVDFVVTPQAVNLTHMLGSLIANYVYDLEQATAGAGVAWLYEYFPILNGGYIPFTTGALQSIVLSKHKLTEFNQWNEEWELGTINADGTNGVSSTTIRSKNYTRISPNTKYYFYNGTLSSNTISIRFYDINHNYIGSTDINGHTIRWNTSAVTPANAYYVRFVCQATYGITYKNDICINFSGERNGEYEPYNGHEYALDSSKELRGVSKIDSNGKLYFYGDRYKDGVTRYFALIDLSMLDYTKYDITISGVTTSMFRALINGIKPHTGQTTAAEIMCSKYPRVASAYRADKTIYVQDTVSGIDIVDSGYSDASEFKTAMTGVMLLYELATTTMEDATPVPNPQISSPDGTEEYVDPRVEAGTIPFAIPTGHETKYLQNLRQKLDDLPFAPSEYGDYLVRVSTDGIAFIPFANGTQIPTIPTSDGTYDLVATVSNGAITLSWVARS